MKRGHEDFEKIDTAMFEVKYLKKWTLFFCQIGFVFFLMSCRSTSKTTLT